AYLFGLCNISIPETPPSMRKKLEAIRRRKYVSDQTNTSLEGISIQESPPTTSIQKRLFTSKSNETTPSGSPLSNPTVIKECAESASKDDLSRSANTPTANSTSRAEMLGHSKNKRKSSSPRHLSPTPISGRTSVETLSESDLIRCENICVSSSCCDAESDQSGETHEKGLSLSSLVTSKPGKRKKLLKLDDQPLEKLLSPVLSQSCGLNKGRHWQFPKPQKPPDGGNVIILPASSKPKMRTHKRKADQLHLTDTGDSSSSASKKRPKSDTALDKLNPSEDVHWVRQKSDGNSVEKEHSKQRHQSVVSETTTIKKVSRRKSCMPSISSQGMEAGKPYSRSPTDSPIICENRTHEVQPLSMEGLQSKPGKYPSTQGCIEDKKPHRRKSVPPKRSPVKSTVTLVQRYSSKHSSTGVLKGGDQSNDMQKVDNTKEITNSAFNVITCKPSVSGMHKAYSSSGSSVHSFVSQVSSSTITTGSRRSIDEFSLSGHRHHKKKLASLSSAVDSSSDESHRRQKASRDKNRTVKKKGRKKHPVGHCSEWGLEANDVQSGKQGLSEKPGSDYNRSLVMTNLHSGEQDIVRSVVKKLGAFSIEARVSPKTTHLVCGNNRRTLNVLLGISTGCWLLSLEWVIKSLEAGLWLAEEPFEQNEYFPAAHASRVDRMKTGDGVPYKSSIFSDKELFFVAENTVPCQKDLIDLLRLCGGQIQLHVISSFHWMTTNYDHRHMKLYLIVLFRIPFSHYYCVW
ncbi:hypothetical protein LSH36_1076g00034, partial [Paralvinella palmiformis]